MHYGDRIPEWYLRAPLAVAYFGIALLLSIATAWWVGLAMVGFLAVLFLLVAYAPWVFFFHRI